MYASYHTAKRLVDECEAPGLLRELTGRRRNRVFRYEPYVALFAEDADPPAPETPPQRTESQAQP